MISYEEALQAVLGRVSPTPPRSAKYDASCAAWSEFPIGSTLADTIRATIDSPRFSNSAVDGYGISCADLSGPLRIVRTVAAGDVPGDSIQAGEAVRLFTGAPVPSGVDAIAMQEDCTVEESGLIVREPIRAGSHIRWRGEQYVIGEPLLPSGTPVTPAVLGLLAENGIDSFRFHRPPRVAVVTTGEELGQLGTEIGPWSIYDSNGPCLSAAVRSLAAWPCDGVKAYHAGDDRARIRETMRQALVECDVLITTGGVSVGDRDLVKDALGELGVEQVFWRIAMKPGKPVYFGYRGQTLVFGLPGNPVSALLAFHVLVRPAIRRMLGYGDELHTLPAKLSAPVWKMPGRAEFVRGTLDSSGHDLRVAPTEGQGSHMMLGTATADCLIHIPTASGDLPTGAVVRISLLRWGLI